MIKRKRYTFRKGNVIEVEEYHDGKYGAPGSRRKKKEKATPEQIVKINQWNKEKRCRHKLLNYFDKGDLFVTWTYRVKDRPESMKEAMKDFQVAMRKVRKEFKKQDVELRWIRNIERGTKGAWHIHLIIKRIENIESVVSKAWTKGGTYTEEIKQSAFYDEDFSQLAHYMCKDENTKEKKGEKEQRPRLRESNYRTSRNMPLPEPKVDKIKRWKKEVKPKKGYYIEKIHEGINPVTGFLYRRVTMIKIERLRI